MDNARIQRSAASGLQGNKLSAMLPSKISVVKHAEAISGARQVGVQWYIADCQKNVIVHESEHRRLQVSHHIRRSLHGNV